jgi:hypothetical protein
MALIWTGSASNSLKPVPFEEEFNVSLIKVQRRRFRMIEKGKSSSTRNIGTGFPFSRMFKFPQQYSHF